MLLDGFNHVAILTKDTKRLHAFYQDVFAGRVPREGRVGPPVSSGVGVWLVHVGRLSLLNVF